MARANVEALRRDQIFEAAARSIAGKGLDRTTIRDVAEAAGVSTGTVNYYFRGKDALLMQTLLHVSERIQQRCATAMVDRGGDAREELAALVDAMLPTDTERYRDWQIWLMAWNEATYSQAVRQLISDRMQLWGKALRGIISRWPGVSPDEPTADLFVRDFGAFLHGLCVELLLSESPAQISESARTTLLRFADCRLAGHHFRP